jgi:fused signal recognition particle receptor
MSSWTSKIKNIFSSSSNFSNKLKSIFLNQKIDQSILDKFHDLLISSDFGLEVTDQIIKQVKKNSLSSQETEGGVKKIIEKIIIDILSGAAKPLELDKGKLNIILFTGVNGSGKTTTIGKLAKRFIDQGLKVKIAACDTFRAAAFNQAELWSKKVGAEIVIQDDKADPASIAYRAILQSRENNTDLLLIDTAGRLQNNKNLMNELEKIVRVIRKRDETAPHHSLLVLDGTSGQNTISQCEHFQKVAAITGLIITKLDGTAKAGTIINLVQKFNLPIHFIGIGEKADDLKEFDAYEYARSLVNE